MSLVLVNRQRELPRQVHILIGHINENVHFDGQYSGGEMGCDMAMA
jgi:hypothetical protein